MVHYDRREVHKLIQAGRQPLSRVSETPRGPGGRHELAGQFVSPDGRLSVRIHGGRSWAEWGALAAVPLLAKHEQNPPSAEQPFSEHRGGEEQGNSGTLLSL